MTSTSTSTAMTTAADNHNNNQIADEKDIRNNFNFVFVDESNNAEFDFYNIDINTDANPKQSVNVICTNQAPLSRPACMYITIDLDFIIDDDDDEETTAANALSNLQTSNNNNTVHDIDLYVICDYSRVNIYNSNVYNSHHGVSCANITVNVTSSSSSSSSSSSANINSNYHHKHAFFITYFGVKDINIYNTFFDEFQIQLLSHNITTGAVSTAGEFQLDGNIDHNNNDNVVNVSRPIKFDIPSFILNTPQHTVVVGNNNKKNGNTTEITVAYAWIFDCAKNVTFINYGTLQSLNISCTNMHSPPQNDSNAKNINNNSSVSIPSRFHFWNHNYTNALNISFINLQLRNLSDIFIVNYGAFDNSVIEFLVSWPTNNNSNHNNHNGSWVHNMASFIIDNEGTMNHLLVNTTNMFNFFLNEYSNLNRSRDHNMDDNDNDKYILQLRCTINVTSSISTAVIANSYLVLFGDTIDVNVLDWGAISNTDFVILSPVTNGTTNAVIKPSANANANAVNVDESNTTLLELLSSELTVVVSAATSSWVQNNITAIACKYIDVSLLAGTMSGVIYAQNASFLSVYCSSLDYTKGACDGLFIFASELTKPADLYADTDMDAHKAFGFKNGKQLRGGYDDENEYKDDYDGYGDGGNNGGYTVFHTYLHCINYGCWNLNLYSKNGLADINLVTNECTCTLHCQSSCIDVWNMYCGTRESSNNKNMNDNNNVDFGYSDHSAFSDNNCAPKVCCGNNMLKNTTRYDWKCVISPTCSVGLDIALITEVIAGIVLVLAMPLMGYRYYRRKKLERKRMESKRQPLNTITRKEAVVPSVISSLGGANSAASSD